MPPLPSTGPLDPERSEESEDKRQRLVRLAAFTRQLSAGVQREFTGILNDAAAQQALPAATRNAVVALQSRLKHLDEVTRQAETHLHHASAWDADSEAAGLIRVLAAAGQGLEFRALQLRSDPVIKKLRGAVTARGVAPAPGRAAGSGDLTRAGVAMPPATGELATGPSGKPAGLRGVLSRWIEKLETHALEPEPVAVDPAQQARREAYERRLQAFEATLQLARQIMAYVGPRLALCGTVTGVLRFPAAPPSWFVVVKEMPVAADKAELAPTMREWLMPLARVFMNDRRAARDAQVAVGQWELAKPRVSEGEALHEALRADESGPLEVLGERAEAGAVPVRLAVLPLSHLHLTFRNVPLLQDLFPAPAGQPLQASAPARPG